MPSSNLKNSVKNTIERYSMINKGDTVIAAVSGGADSVALLYVLYSLKDELGFSLAACHVNHNLRGEESDSDERFVRRMCRFLDIPLYTASIKVNDLRQKHDSLEECARRLRYELSDAVWAVAISLPLLMLSKNSYLNRRAQSSRLSGFFRK